MGFGYNVDSSVQNIVYLEEIVAFLAKFKL
jgi:hypothetical protein